MKKSKITVLKTLFLEDIAKEHGGSNVCGPCPAYKGGEVFYADFRKPEGFCDEAWKSIQHYVFACSHGGKEFYYGGWNREPGVAIASCPDGFRPVIFKIEATDIEATRNN
mgnify:CR=1 FL=1